MEMSSSLKSHLWVYLLDNWIGNLLILLRNLELFHDSKWDQKPINWTDFVPRAFPLNEVGTEREGLDWTHGSTRSEQIGKITLLANLFYSAALKQFTFW